MSDVCSDNRFELIDAAKAALLKNTNIEDSQADMAALDSILYRCWQMGWLDQLRDANTRYHELFGTPERAARTLETIADSLYSSAWSDDNATLSDVMCALVDKCDECVAQGLPGRGVSTKCGEVDADALLEWLRGDAE